MQSLSNWGRWGEDDQRGTLNHLSAEKTKRALGLVQNSSPYSHELQWATNGEVVIAARDGLVDIYPIDRDGDGVVDSIDNCRNIANPDQADTDGDGFGDACESTLPPGC